MNLIAVLGDIHANFPALATVYAEAVRRKANRVIHTGDLVGYAPFPNETVEFIRAHGIVGVRGNYDKAVAEGAEHCGCAFTSDEQARIAGESFAWTKAHTSDAAKRYLSSMHDTVEFQAGELRVAVFHATPHKNNLYWHAGRPESFFSEMAEKINADLYIFGHTHLPFVREIGSRIFVNAGSVGKPKDGDPRACMVMVDAGPGKAIKTEIVRISYDVDSVAESIREAGLPTAHAEALLTGRG